MCSLPLITCSKHDSFFSLRCPNFFSLVSHTKALVWVAAVWISVFSFYFYYLDVTIVSSYSVRLNSETIMRLDSREVSFKREINDSDIPVHDTPRFHVIK